MTMMTVKEQRAFLCDFPGADARIRRGQAPTLRDRETIHKALVMVYSMLVADLTEKDVLNGDDEFVIRT